jgi:anti-anti-sigma regulatory factor
VTDLLFELDPSDGDGAPMVTFDGDLAVDDASVVINAIEQLRGLVGPTHDAPAEDTVILDLRNLHSCDVAGAYTLLHAEAQLQCPGVHVFFVNVAADLESMLIALRRT